MRRRDFISLVASAAAVWPRYNQPSSRTHRRVGGPVPSACGLRVPLHRCVAARTGWSNGTVTAAAAPAAADNRLRRVKAIIGVPSRVVGGLWLPELGEYSQFFGLLQDQSGVRNAARAFELGKFVQLSGKGRHRNLRAVAARWPFMLRSHRCSDLFSSGAENPTG